MKNAKRISRLVTDSMLLLLLLGIVALPISSVGLLNVNPKAQVLSSQDSQPVKIVPIEMDATEYLRESTQTTQSTQSR